MKNILIILAVLSIVSCTSIPKTTTPNHNIQLTCEIGSRYFFINMQDVPKKSLFDFVSDNAWYIHSLSTLPNFDQQPSVTFGPPKQNKKRFLQKPYAVTDDALYFSTYSHEWEINRINMQTIMREKLNNRRIITGVCEYGFQADQFRK